VGHAYPVHSNIGDFSSDGPFPAQDVSGLRFYGNGGAGAFIATAGTVTVEAVDDTTITFRLTDVLFLKNVNGVPNPSSAFVVNGTVGMYKVF